MSISKMTKHGTRDGYYWLWSNESRLSDVLHAVPELVLDQVVAITACDSGIFRPSAEERAAGWVLESDVAFSPRIRELGQLPHDQWDEWYVLAHKRDLPRLHVFVNNVSFTPEPQSPPRDFESTWDRVAAIEDQRLATEQAEWFWHQLLSVRPAAFLAENDSLICVVASETVFERVLAAVMRDAG